MKDWKEKKETIDNILELIEDKVYPARRNISDYVAELFGYPKDLDEYIADFYKRKDEIK